MPEAAIIAVAKAVEAVALFLATPEGQASLKQAREDGEAFRKTWGTWWAVITKR